MGPPVQAPPQRGFCPGGRALWLGEIADCGIKKFIKSCNSTLSGLIMVKAEALSYSINQLKSNGEFYGR